MRKLRVWMQGNDIVSPPSVLSNGGTRQSVDGSFRTSTGPVSVLVEPASALSTTRAQVVGSVDARGRTLPLISNIGLKIKHQLTL